MSAVVTQPVNATVTVPSEGSGLAEPPLLFNVACTSNVVMEIAGSLLKGSVGTEDFVLTMQFYNILSPGFISSVSVPVTVSVPQNLYIPFAVVQSTTLTAGTYASQLSISSTTAAGVVSVDVAGFQSVLIVRQ